jgi:hypothetical protein
MNKSLLKILSLETFTLPSEDFLLRIIFQNPQKMYFPKFWEISRP